MFAAAVRFTAMQATTAHSTQYIHHARKGSKNITQHSTHADREQGSRTAHARKGSKDAIGDALKLHKPHRAMCLSHHPFTLPYLST